MLNLVFGRHLGFAKLRGLGGVKEVGEGQGRDSRTFSRVFDPPQSVLQSIIVHAVHYCFSPISSLERRIYT